MQASTRIERSLAEALLGAQGKGHPPRLAAAMRHAVFPAGARVRPRLCLAVAQACGIDQPELAVAAAASVELLHCASLVHDDLPCFDDAPLRRGRPSVHQAFGERLAVLAGDALIVLAFQTLARGAAHAPRRGASVTLAVAAGVGMPAGIAAGQAWETEHEVELRAYHRAKTGALFAASAEAGALAAGAEASRWREFGDWLGEAYQVADDIRDAAGDADQLGKPVGRDALLARPSIARERGLPAAMLHFESLIERAQLAVPEGDGNAALRQLVRLEAARLIPRELAGELVADAA